MIGFVALILAIIILVSVFTWALIRLDNTIEYTLVYWCTARYRYTAEPCECHATSCHKRIVVTPGARDKLLDYSANFAKLAGPKAQIH